MSYLSPRKSDVLRAIASYTAEHGFPPTVREIGEAIGLSSSSTVHAHIKDLERLGFIQRGSAGCPRQIRLVSEREEQGK